VGFLLGIGTAGTVAGNAAPHEARMALAQRLRAEAQPLGRTGREVLYENVGALHEPGEDLAGGGMLCVERHALLRAVGPDKVRRLSLDRAVGSSRGVGAAGTLDLDHARAELGELPCGERSGDHLLERDHGDPFERPHTNSMVSPGKGRPAMRVLQVSPGRTGSAPVMTP